MAISKVSLLNSKNFVIFKKVGSGQGVRKTNLSLVDTNRSFPLLEPKVMTTKIGKNKDLIFKRQKIDYFKRIYMFFYCVDL